jgi:hypothetical protein
VVDIDLEWLLIFGNNMYFLFVSYAILGAGIKYIDAAYDEQVFSKTVALLVAPILGVLWAITILTDPVSASILLAILLGVLIKGKVDNRAHMLGFSVILVIIVVARVELWMLPLGFLAAAAVLDEVGNDVIGYNQAKLKQTMFRYRFMVYFFGRRYVMKVAVLYLVLLGVFPLYFLVALIFFDEAYIITELYARSR